MYKTVLPIDILSRSFLFLGEIVDFVSEKHGIHTVASLLKMYLRGLPEPVVPFSFYGRFTTVVAGMFAIFFLIFVTWLLDSKSNMKVYENRSINNRFSQNPEKLQS